MTKDAAGLKTLSLARRFKETPRSFASITSCL
jgi:hypothetical protein